MNKRISVKTRVLIILLAIFVFLVAALSVSICMFVKADNVAAQAERLERVIRATQKQERSFCRSTAERRCPKTL